MKDVHDIIKRPVMTEKSYDLLESGVYTFEVELGATKPQIRQAVEEVFGVDVDSVHTVRGKGKIKRQGRTQGRTPRVKKAYVTLTPGSKTIPFFENMGQ
ncbi:MAG: 50S ribosomal protein L23 [Clostridia bacterium]|nr:50S ribosomal protein L23 [Clostridia bacterium]